MTAVELRRKKITNIGLLWQVYGHDVDIEELMNFSSDELKQIYHRDGREKISEKILHLLSCRGMSEGEIINFL